MAHEGANALLPLKERPGERAPLTPRHWLLKPDVDFLVLLGYATLIFLPFLNCRILPVHDTMGAFQGFQVFYETFFWHGELVRWLPYGTYGVPADVLQLGSLAPAGYLAGLAGYLCGCRDVLLLFKLSLWLEQLFFLFGLYLLAGYIYRARITRFCVCLTALTTVTWVSQICFDWRIFYLLPLILYLLVRFWTERRSQFLWLAGIVATASLLGTAPYFAALLLFLLTVILTGLLAADRGALRAVFRPTRRELLFLALFFLAAGTYLWQVRHALEGLHLLSAGRDASGKVPLSEFLTYGGTGIGPLRSLFTGWPPYGDNTCYLGLLALPCLGWALVRARAPVFWAFLGGALALVLLSCGGIVARLVYHFPAMSLYRHIGLVYGPVKILLLLCAGFGLDDVLRRLAAGWPTNAQVSRSRLVACLLGTLLVGELLLDEPGRQLVAHHGAGTLTLADLSTFLVCLRLLFVGGAVCAAVLLLRRGALQYRGGRTVAAAFFLLAFAFDLGSYRWLLWAMAPKAPGPTASQAGVFDCRPMPFRETRSPAPPDERSSAALRLYLQLALAEPNRATYSIAANALGWDPSPPAFRLDFLSARVAGLIGLRGGRPTMFPGPDFAPADDGWLKSALGSMAPKVRLVRHPCWCSTDALAEAMVRRIPTAADTLVLQGAASTETALASPGWEPPGHFRILHFSPNRLNLEVTVGPGGPAWLVYADAYHEDWRCTVNGKPTPVLPANFAFKAVEVPPGRSDVRFGFGAGKRAVRGYLTALFGLTFAGAVLLLGGRLALYGGAAKRGAG